MSRASCRECIYYRHLSAAAGGKGCHYMLDTGKKRDCSADNCDKHCTNAEIRRIQREKQKDIKLYSRPNRPLRTAMKANKLSGVELAKLIGITQSTFSRKLNLIIHCGTPFRFTAPEKAMIANILNISPNDIE